MRSPYAESAVTTVGTPSISRIVLRPRFVVRDFEDYLGCGLLERGLVHLA